jgi:hypothetical protein
MLTPDILSDVDAFGSAIDQMLLRSKRYRKMTRRVLRAQGRLRRAVRWKGWARYLRLEEVVNERAGHENELLIRWAFEQGRRSRRR